MNDLFPDIIGQDAAKKQITFYLREYHSTKILQHLFFSGCKGSGKSLFARETAKHLVLYDDAGQPIMKEDGVTPKKKAFLEVNISSVGGVGSFTQFLLDDVIDKDVTVFLDEVHGLKTGVTNLLLSILNPTVTNKNTLNINGLSIDIDFSRQTFLLASSEPHLVFAPLLDRITPITLSYYSGSELAEILRKAVPDVTFYDNVLEEIAPTLRSSARCAIKMGQNIRTYLCGKKEFGMDNWHGLKTALSILPYGVDSVEVSLLRILRDNPAGSSLTNLAAKTGLSREAIMRQYESYLQRLNFMKIEQGRGRIITPKGIEFLDSLSKP